MRLLKTFSMLFVILLQNDISHAADLEEERTREKPSVAYRKFLTYAPDETKRKLITVYDNKEKSLVSYYHGNYDATKFLESHELAEMCKTLKVNLDISHSDSFQPLSSATIEQGINKLVIRNLNMDNVVFTFNAKASSEIVKCVFTGSLKKKAQASWHNIAPCAFKDVPSMALQEYIISGKDFNKEKEYQGKQSSLEIFANADPEITPLQIILVRCTGTWYIEGLTQERISQLFINKSPALILKPVFSPEK